MKTALEWKKYYSTTDFKENYIYEETIWVSGAPRKAPPSACGAPLPGASPSICMRGGEKGAPFRSVSMSRENKGVWSWDCAEELHGVYYDYTLDIDGRTVRSAGSLCQSLRAERSAEHGRELKTHRSGGMGSGRAPEEKTERIIYEAPCQGILLGQIRRLPGGIPGKIQGVYLYGYYARQ